MVIWIHGNSKSGKTTFARKLVELISYAIHLDGDEMRATICADLDLSEAGRRENNLRIARLAKLLADKGFPVVVSTICPYRDLRDEAQKICDCKFIQLKGGIDHPDYPYEQ